MAKASAIVPIEGDKLPAHLQGSQGLGNENVDSTSMEMPRLNLLQQMSPQVQEGTDQYVQGAKAGMILNTLTKELSTEVHVVNLFFQHEYPVFRKREAGGGLVGTFRTKEEANSFIINNGLNPEEYDVVDTDRHILMLLDADMKPIGPASLLMQSTKLRVSKNWNSQIATKTQGADRFASVWKLGTSREKNSKGTFYNFNVELVGWAPEALYNEAKEAYESISAALGAPAPAATEAAA